MNRRQKIIVSVTGIFIVLLILVGLTYAYFLTRIQGNEESKSISVTTANLLLVYGDGNGILESAEPLMPGKDVKFLGADGTAYDNKTFTVTNNGNDKVNSYLVYFENVTNTLLRPQDLVYTVECTSYTKYGTDEQAVSGECFGVSSETPLPVGTGTGTGPIVTNDIEVGITHEYKLKMKYVEPGVPQTDDMGKTIEAKINIADSKGFNPYNSNQNTLAYKIVNNALNVTSEEKELGYAEFVNSSSISYGSPSSTIFLLEEESVTNDETRSYTTNKNITNYSSSLTLKYTIGDYYSYDESTKKYTIVNKDNSDLTVLSYYPDYKSLENKYIYRPTGQNNTTPLSTPTTSIYYVTEATETGFKYITLTGGVASNDKYVTYGDSYEFDKTTGKYNVVNKNGSDLKTVKYASNYKELFGKYISSTTLSTSASTGRGLDSVYKVSENSTEFTLVYDKTTIASTTTESIENVLSTASDDYGTSYYYRGDVENNYLTFNNMCWRIMRIEGDGSVKIILADPDDPCSAETLADADGVVISGGIDNSLENTGDIYYFNEEYEGDTLIYTDRLLLDNYILNFSELKGWYNTNFSSVDNKVKDSKICIDNELYNQNGNLITIDNFPLGDPVFSASYFIHNDATFKCYDNTKNVTTKIFMPTANEVQFAGISYEESYESYLMKNTSSFWLLDRDFANGVFSSNDYGGSDYMYVIDIYHIVDIAGNYSKINSDGSSSYSQYGQRPTISLIKGITATGSGTIDDPYIVQ